MLENTTAPSILAPLLQMENPSSNPSRIAIKANHKILFIDPAEILTLEAQGNHVLLQLLSGPAFLLRQSISAVAEKLLPYGFVRIHRSALVNSAFVEEIRPLTSGESVLRIQGGKELHVSRTFRKNLQSISPLWLGTHGLASE